MRWGETALAIARRNPDVRIDEPEAPAPLSIHVDRYKEATEHEEQTALFCWAEAMQAEHPDLRWMFAVPNGGHRHAAVAARLKAEGVKAGVPDVFLAVPRGGRAGLWIELKRADGSNHPTPEQRAWLAWFAANGYATAVCYGALEAMQEIEAYLGQGE